MLSLIESLLTDKHFLSCVKHIINTYPVGEKILEEGKVRITLSGDVIKTINPSVADLEKGDVFGEFSLFEDSPSSANVVTISEAQLIQIDIQSFRKFLDTNPDIGYQFLHEFFFIFVRRLQKANKSVLRLLEWGLNVHEIDKHL